MVDGRIFFDFLTQDQRLFLNAVFDGYAADEFTKEICLNSLRFSQALCSEDFKGMYADLIAKIEEVDEEDWNYMRLLLPLAVDYDEPEEDTPVVYAEDVF